MQCRRPVRLGRVDVGPAFDERAHRRAISTLDGLEQWTAGGGETCGRREKHDHDTPRH
jgi:hypothetical protein